MDEAGQKTLKDKWSSLSSSEQGSIASILKKAYESNNNNALTEKEIANILELKNIDFSLNEINSLLDELKIDKIDNFIKIVKELGKENLDETKINNIVKNLNKGKNVDEIIKTSYVKSIDFSKLGTGKVGDFTNLKGANINEVLSRIPKDATKRELRPIAGKVSEGFEYKWVQDGKTWRVRVHGPDASAPLGTNASEGWVVRIQQGKKYMDSNGVFHSDGISNPNSPYFNEELINDTHIPITIN